MGGSPSKGQKNTPYLRAANSHPLNGRDGNARHLLDGVRDGQFDVFTRCGLSQTAPVLPAIHAPNDVEFRQPLRRCNSVGYGEVIGN